MIRRIAVPLALFSRLAVSPALLPNARAATETEAATVQSSDPGPVTESVAGAYAAIGCGLFARALMGGMVVPGVIAGAIATCGFMFIDALVLER